MVPIDCPQLLQSLNASLNRHLLIQHDYLNRTQLHFLARLRHHSTVVDLQQNVRVLAQCLLYCIFGKLDHLLPIHTIVALVFYTHPPSQALNDFQVYDNVISYHD